MLVHYSVSAYDLANIYNHPTTMEAYNNYVKNLLIRATKEGLDQPA